MQHSMIKSTNREKENYPQCLSSLVFLPWTWEIPSGRWRRQRPWPWGQLLVEGGQAGVMTIGSKRVLAKTVNANEGFVPSSKQALNVIRNNIMLVFCRQEQGTDHSQRTWNSYFGTVGICMTSNGTLANLY